jgi:hypothetical protein
MIRLKDLLSIENITPTTRGGLGGSTFWTLWSKKYFWGCAILFES